MKLGTLRYNESTEEGTIEIDWSKMPDGIILLDVLKDWIYDLTVLYEGEKQSVFKE